MGWRIAVCPSRKLPFKYPHPPLPKWRFLWYCVGMRQLNEEFLSIDEVARVLRVTRKTVEKLIHSGRLRAIRVGRLWRVPRAALYELLPPRPEEPER